MDRKSKAEGVGGLSNPRNGEIRGRIDSSRSLNISGSLSGKLYVLAVLLLDYGMHEI